MSPLIQRIEFGINEAKHSFRSTWNRAVNVYEARQDGYPYSLKEIWDAQTNLVCAMLRNSVGELVQSYPRIPSTYIRGLLNTSTHFRRLDGLTPFQAVLKAPGFETLANAKAVIRRDVYDLDEIMSGAPWPTTSRSFFAPELRNSK